MLRSDLAKRGISRLRLVVATTWGLAFVMLGTTELITLPHFQGLQDSSALIDRAGRQRMLSQRGALLLHREAGDREKVRAIAAELRGAHEEIRDWIEAGRTAHADALHERWEIVDRSLRPLLIALESHDRAPADRHADDFLVAMNDLVNALADETDSLRAEIAQGVRAHSWAVAISIALLSLFVIGPSTKRIARLFRRLEEQRSTAVRQQIELDERREHLENLFTVSRDPLFLLDGIGTILAVSPSIADTFGYEPDELVGRPIEVLQPEPHRSLHRSYMLRANQRKPGDRRFYELDHEVDALHRDGTVVPCRLKVGRTLTTEGPLYVGILRDISVERAREQALEAQKEALESARQSAERASRAKSEFLTNVSHEIRTPMTAIVGLLEILRDDLGEGDEDQVRLIDRVRMHGRHLVELITDLLDFSRLESGKVDIQQETFDVVTLGQDLDESFRASAVEKGLRYEVEVGEGAPRKVETDPARLRQVLAQLIQNAIKFTDHGSVDVAVEGCTVADGRPGIAFTVTDTGCGLEPEAREWIFEAFQQRDATLTRDFGGLGLGLTIAHHLTRLLGATLELVRSEKGEGTEFRFSLPIAVERPEESERLRLKTTAVRKQPLEGRRLLVVEDTPDSRLLFVKVLERAGAMVTAAENGALACTAVEEAEEPFDLIIMDIQMPVMDGLVATETLRECGVTTPIAALTAHATSGEEERCLSVGCDQFWTKPITPAELTRRVAGVLQESPTSA